MIVYYMYYMWRDFNKILNLNLNLLLKKSTPNLMIYGELGTYPMSVYIKLGMVNYWSKLINGKGSKLSLILYKFLYIKN